MNVNMSKNIDECCINTVQYSTLNQYCVGTESYNVCVFGAGGLDKHTVGTGSIGQIFTGKGQQYEDNSLTFGSTSKYGSG